MCSAAPVEHLLTGLPRLPFDGCAELWFDDENDLAGLLEVLATHEDIARDVAEFTDPSASQLLVMAETRIV